MLTHKIVKELVAGEWLSLPENPDEPLKGGAFDTRSTGDSQIFFAWRGEASDGHDYVSKIKGTPIRLIVAEKRIPPVEGVAVLKVDDSLNSLHRIAGHVAKNFPGKIVSLTGSAGKTTAKGWLAHILARKFRVLFNKGSFNNHIGCPVTLLDARTDHEAAVLEMGASGSGELDRLSSIAPADIAVLLNVGHAHLGKFGSLENTYKAKVEIFNHRRPDALALIPAKDPKIGKMLADKEIQTQTFGGDSGLFSNRKGNEGELEFETPWGNKSVKLNVPGAHVPELLSALFAVCWKLGMNWEEIEPSLHDLPSEKGRAILREGANGIRIYDDTYNANPESVINMLRTICELKAESRIGVVGNLAEMDEGLKDSARIITDDLPRNLDSLYFCGETGKILTDETRKKRPDMDVRYFEDIASIPKVVQDRAKPGTVVGVKGSRSAHLERLVGALQNYSTSCELKVCGKLAACPDCPEY